MSCPDKLPVIVACRGAWHGAPENSIAAINAAVALGVEMVEIDIQRSSDGHFYLTHDTHLKRMAGLDLDPRDLTLGELQQSRLWNRNGPPENLVYWSLVSATTGAILITSILRH